MHSFHKDKDMAGNNKESSYSYKPSASPRHC